MNPDAMLCLIALAVLLSHWTGFFSGFLSEGSNGFHAITILLSFACGLVIAGTIIKTLALHWLP